MVGVGEVIEEEEGLEEEEEEEDDISMRGRKRGSKDEGGW